MSEITLKRSAAPSARRGSPGLWTLAWRRLRRDTVGMASLVVVTFFLALMIASYFGVVADHWSDEIGISYANPLFLAGEENLEAAHMGSGASVSNIPMADLSNVDPLAPRYPE